MESICSNASKNFWHRRAPNTERVRAGGHMGHFGFGIDQVPVRVVLLVVVSRGNGCDGEGDPESDLPQ